MDGETIEIEKNLVTFESVEEEVRGEEVIPHVIEPSFGIDRILYTVLDHSYYEDAVDGETRAVLRFKPAVAPIEVAVLPLMDRKELVAPARKILEELRRRGMRVDYDTSGSIGRRYRRNDEAGTPYEVTVDYETLEQGTVTIRDRDSMQPDQGSRVAGGRQASGVAQCGIIKFQEAGDLVASCEERVNVEKRKSDSVKRTRSRDRRYSLVPDIAVEWQTKLVKEIRRKAIHLSGLSVPFGLLVFGRTFTAAMIALALVVALVLEMAEAQRKDQPSRGAGPGGGQGSQLHLLHHQAAFYAFFSFRL